MAKDENKMHKKAAGDKKEHTSQSCHVSSAADKAELAAEPFGNMEKKKNHKKNNSDCR